MFPRWYRIARSYDALMDPSKPFGVSLDITNRCNLSCSHCYYYMKPYEQDNLNDDQWIEFVKHIKQSHPSIAQATYVGGEPMLRKDLIEKLHNYFRFNWIVTNGTLPIPKWPWATVWFSLDGIEPIHDQIRGRGMFQKTWSNIIASENTNAIHTVLNALNIKTLPEFLRVVSALPVEGVQFSSYTPMTGVADDPLYIDRSIMAISLHEAKKEYGDFILQGEEELETFRNGLAWGDNCALKNGKVLSFSSKGTPKGKCVMGDEMDCNRCGCAVPLGWHSLLKLKSKESANLLLKVIV